MSTLDFGLSTPSASPMVDIRRAASGSSYRCCKLVQAGPSIAKRRNWNPQRQTKSAPVPTCKIRQLGTNAANMDGAPRFPLRYMAALSDGSGERISVVRWLARLQSHASPKVSVTPTGEGESRVNCFVAAWVWVWRRPDIFKRRGI